MEQIFTSDERAADLIGWAEKLNGLGGLIEALGCCNDDGLDRHFGMLGQIIVDYAHAIKVTLSAVYPELDELLEGFETISLGGIDSKYKQLKRMRECPHRQTMIKEKLEEVQGIKEKVSIIFDMEKDLKKMLNRVA
jgi:hypothetical protein